MKIEIDAYYSVGDQVAQVLAIHSYLDQHQRVKYMLYDKKGNCLFEGYCSLATFSNAAEFRVKPKKVC